jgi:hypothetical protein
MKINRNFGYRHVFFAHREKKRGGKEQGFQNRITQAFFERFLKRGAGETFFQKGFPRIFIPFKS